MFAPWSALVLILIAGPKEPDKAFLTEHFALIQMPLQMLAIEQEILDPREVRYILARPEDIGDDIKLLRRRYRELQDAPYLADSYRFPPREVINELLAFNRSYREYLKVRIPIDVVNTELLQNVLRETEALYTFWDAARDAQQPFYYVTVRRAALQKLRDLLGEEAYYRSEFPPNVPLWRFQWIDPPTP